MKAPGRVRPFYSEFAWAFDLVIERPVLKECGTIAGWLVARGVFPGSALLDAGCGTGRYAIELGRRGYVVRGVDLSKDLIEQATRSQSGQSANVSFAVADLLTLPAASYDAVLCRGVLNDLVDDADRSAAVGAFSRNLRDGGVLVLDVREWEATAARKLREPLFRKRVESDRGKLTFTSVTHVDTEHRLLIIDEQHTLEANGRQRSTDYEFVMRCWTRSELESLLALHGFGSATCFGAYDGTVPPGATDRLIVITEKALRGNKQKRSDSTK